MSELTHSIINTLSERLEIRQQNGLLRQLRTADNLIDFCSNDYLGFARSADLKQAIQQADASASDARTGATGSRLLAGQTYLAAAVEDELASFYQTESALIFNSGYDANLGLLACLPQANDTLLTDELVHASMIDGARLSYASRHRFRHNDLNDLDSKLQQTTRSGQSGQVFVAIESVYSMDGDLAPLTEIVALCERYGAALIVDEAHATGVYGPNGEGMVVALGLADRILARVHTFGKALGVHGAAVVGSSVLRNYLINFARPFIYTTALPPHSLLAIRCAHQLVQLSANARKSLHERIQYFHQRVASQLPETTWTNSSSPIQGLIVPGNDYARHIASEAQRARFDVRAILSPTVPVGQERLRICIHLFNTTEEIDRLVSAFQSALTNAVHL
ncbi:aminotransferase class I/II-fold pyridoxal phosphate-dependent enzyme [Spirosoma endbachense]|uniref:Aminotransferase class I/II-fold pyridoxal phosphate-dependent enzyme n=1 Tax=Spirosoma endbachense TaxID=2666025 RepID=A0A6P1W103_9BACT|nr:8-amino-7-oxononanoate synthase [Spirosoma endbachense]QHV98574.1 aminotransferase class I/II-fold pyridoxal phosphate-dependent enzyme [Spirosoma endbachense]